MFMHEYANMLLTLGVLAITVGLFIYGRIRSDVVAMCALLSLTLFGILNPQEAFSGFSNTVIFITGGMFIISGAIVRTGLASFISGKILGIAGKNTNILFIVIMLLATIIGSMVSNTGTVAIMMPIVVSMSQTINQSPSRFLMPLAFMSSIGGMFTLIGNSPNVVANDIYVKAGFPSLTLFSFFPVGVVSFLFGMLILVPVASFFLSRRKNEVYERKNSPESVAELAERYSLSKNMYLIKVPRKSPIVGHCLKDLCFTEKYGVVIQEISRTVAAPFGFHHESQQISPGALTAVEAGDIVRVLGSLEGVQSLVDEYQLDKARPAHEPATRDKLRFDSIGICELVIMSSSRLVKRTVAESGLRDQFNITVLSIQRGDKYIWENIRDQVIKSGDALLVQGTWENIARLERYSMNWVVVGRPRDMAGTGKLLGKMPFVAIVIAAMVAVMALNLIPTVLAVVIAAVVLIFGGCFKNMDEAYSAINWETLILIAGLLPIALAMEKTGITGIVSKQMLQAGTTWGPHAALAVIYGMASLMNILISTTPVALLVSPIALQTALALGVSPLPFMFAVATASSMCFASPFSTPSNALVMSAGRYTFFDYMKLGLPLQILMGVVMVFALPWLFPFAG